MATSSRLRESRTGTRIRVLAGTGALLGLLAGLLVWEIARTRPVRQAVRAYTQLVAAANHQDVEAVRRLCSVRYRAAYSPAPAPEGGIIGLPRGIHKNFRAWKAGPNVWICPTNRVGPVFQFVPEEDGWKFDGPVGLLHPGGQVEHYPIAP